MTPSARQVCGAAAQLIRCSAVRPELIGGYTERALDRGVGKIECPCCDGDIDGDKIMRSEWKAAQPGLGGVFRPLCQGSAISHREIETSVGSGSIPAPVSIQDETEVEWMRVPRDVPPDAPAPW